MKAIISSTYDDKYLYFIPIVTWCWNKLGVDVICFMPYDNRSNTFMHVSNTLVKMPSSNNNWIYNFDCHEHKEATYAQVSRIYAACLDLPEDEVLITSDVDMALFKIPKYEGGFTITGNDLVPPNQYPACYVSAQVKDWRTYFNLNGITYQEALDRLLGNDECQDYRACRWSVDQEQLYKNISLVPEINLVSRSNGQNQFAQNRVDREDTYWRDRLNLDIFDAHLWRTGYTEYNHNNLMELLKYMYPKDNFDWLVNYRNSYVNLL